VKAPESYRRDIPFFIQKSRTEFQKDAYERYDDMVLRQAALHYVDQLWGGYPMQAILDFAADYYDDNEVQWIVEVGCGVGRWIAELASRFPRSSCWGIDYSYQMLRQANDFWVIGRDLVIDLSHKGFQNPINAQSSTLKNLHFGLAKASELPFEDNSQDLVINSFVFDRLADPIESIHEFFRVFKSRR
jgi:ubiquinone/menaquinone biosynthesis C-methylase UbiE